MLTPPGYTPRRRLPARSGREVLLAVRAADGVQVALERFPPEEAERARRELEALRALAAVPGVRHAHDLVQAHGASYLVLEVFQGVTLGEWVREQRPEPGAFLAVAIQLAATLGAVHAARLIHHDVHPGNVIVDPETLATRLCDFGRARPLGSPGNARLDARLERRRSALGYVSPEQTGRMGRGVDSRSDLYSLGATLYFALTAVQPFEGADALALIHAHLARTPPTPLERRPELPATLSRIVMKLLEKEPEDRYQTAQALERDLAHCRAELERGGRIADDFPLGTSDAPPRPLFAPRLYGRERDSAALRDAFEGSATGSCAVVAIEGAPGIGKTALVHEQRRALAERGGYLASGKFDLYRRDVPYSGFTAAFASLAHQILTESDESLSRWKAELLASLGALAPVVVELVPDLGFVLGELHPAPALGPAETQARLGLAVDWLVSAFARVEHPLVLFLDDLQWADPGSLYLLRELLASREPRALLLITAYRSGELDPALLADLERAAPQLTRIALAPLDLEASAQMLSDALGRPPKETRALVACIARKTGSSPLLIQQFVLHLHAHGLIRFEHPHGWAWDDAAVAAADIPDDAVALMIGKLESLSARPLAVIQLASCAGDEFDVELLSDLSGEPPAALAASLFELSEDGVISPSPRGFRFAHDRVREAAQALLGAEERARLHQRAGLLLLERTSEAELAERAFEIADHLNHALERLAPEERRHALRANFAAGRRALQAGSAATAASYLRIAQELHDESDWKADPGLAFEVFSSAAEAAFQTLDLARAKQLIEVLARRPLAPLQRAQVLARQIAVQTVEDRRIALDLLLAGLRGFGIRWSRRPSWLRIRLEIARLDFLLRGPLDESAFRGSPARDPAELAPALLLRAGGAAMVGSSNRLPCLAAAHSLQIYRRHGPLSGPGFALAAYAAFRLAVRGDAAGAQRYCDAAEQWMQRRPNAVLNVRGEFNLQAYVHPWIRPRRSVLEPLLRTAQAAREIGDIEYAFLADYQHAEYAALVGEPLADVVERIAGISRDVRGGRTSYAALQARAYELLRGVAPARGEDAGLNDLATRALRPEPANPIHRYVQVHTVLVLTFLGEHERGSSLAEAIAPTLAAVGAPSAHLADFALCRGLCAVVRSETSSHARAWRRTAQRCLSQLRTWAKHGPDFRHMELLLAAELARVRGGAAAALRGYQEAAQRAAAQQHLHHVALIQERCADLLQASRRLSEAAALRREAVAAYRQWGARRKVEQLAGRSHEPL